MNRCGDSKRITGNLLSAAFSKNFLRPFLEGGNPRNKKSARSISLTEIAAAKADAPGIAKISKFFFDKSLIKFVPGSEIAGVPASVTSAISLNLLKSFPGRY